MIISLKQIRMRSISSCEHHLFGDHTRISLSSIWIGFESKLLLQFSFISPWGCLNLSICFWRLHGHLASWRPIIEVLACFVEGIGAQSRLNIFRIITCVLITFSVCDEFAHFISFIALTLNQIFNLWWYNRSNDVHCTSSSLRLIWCFWNKTLFSAYDSRSV